MLKIKEIDASEECSVQGMYIAGENLRNSYFYYSGLETDRKDKLLKHIREEKPDSFIVWPDGIDYCQYLGRLININRPAESQPTGA